MKRIEFTPPKAVSIPEGKMAGDTFDRLSTYRIKPNGSLCLVAIGDVPMPGYGDKPAPADTSRDMAKASANRYQQKMEGAEPANEGSGGGY